MSGPASRRSRLLKRPRKRCIFPWARKHGGHVISRLLSELPVAVSQVLISKGMVLDNFYLPTRYANGHPEGAPFEHYSNIQSDEAICYAGEIIEFVRAQMAESRKGG
jgi:HEPN domain-containing protein